MLETNVCSFNIYLELNFPCKDKSNMRIIHFNGKARTIREIKIENPSKMKEVKLTKYLKTFPPIILAIFRAENYLPDNAVK